MLSTTVAPAMALPLGSVTVPCREVEETCENAKLTVKDIAAIVRIARFWKEVVVDCFVLTVTQRAHGPLRAERKRKP